MPKLKRNPISMLFHVIRNDAHQLEYDPTTQWKFHRNMTRFWVCNFFVAAFVFFWLPDVWAKASILYLVLVSLYANAATDYGAVPASYAAIKADEIEARQNTPPTNQDVIDAMHEETIAERKPSTFDL